MTKEEFVTELKRMDLPKDQFVILAGGSMLMHGLREGTADMDLACSPELYSSFAWDEVKVSPDVFVEVYWRMDQFDWTLVDGYRCQTLESVLAMKKKMNRPKDQNDILILEKEIERRSI